jgi:hypothetical protein
MNLNRTASRKVERRSTNSPKKAIKGKRGRAPRRTDFRSFGWYETAALSIGIKSVISAGARHAD